MSSGSGGLVQINGKSFGEFYGGLKEGFAMFMNSYRTINKWVRTNGDGLLSETGAYTLKQLIKSTIDQDENAVPTNWEPPSIEQVLFKEAYGRFTTPWKMGAGVYSNIVATKRSGTWVVGIDRRATVKKIGFRSLAKHSLTKGQTIRVEDYAEMIEFGNTAANIPARSLFSIVATNFVSTKIPELMDLLTKSLKRSAENYNLEATGSKYSTGTISENYSTNIMNPGVDFSDAIISDVAIQASLGNLSSNARQQTSKIDQADKNEYLGFVKKNKINLEELSPEVRKVLGL